MPRTPAAGFFTAAPAVGRKRPRARIGTANRIRGTATVAPRHDPGLHRARTPARLNVVSTSGGWLQAERRGTIADIRGCILGFPAIMTVPPGWHDEWVPAPG